MRQNIGNGGHACGSLVSAKHTPLSVSLSALYCFVAVFHILTTSFLQKMTLVWMKNKIKIEIHFRPHWGDVEQVRETFIDGHEENELDATERSRMIREENGGSGLNSINILI